MDKSKSNEFFSTDGIWKSRTTTPPPARGTRNGFHLFRLVRVSLAGFTPSPALLSFILPVKPFFHTQSFALRYIICDIPPPSPLFRIHFRSRQSNLLVGVATSAQVQLPPALSIVLSPSLLSQRSLICLLACLLVCQCLYVPMFDERPDHVHGFGQCSKTPLFLWLSFRSLQ